MLGSPGSSGLVLACLAVFFVLLLIAAIRSTLPPRWKWGLFALKVPAVALLAVCLLDPLVTRRHVKPGENIFVLLGDQSASMSMRQSPHSSETRGEWNKALLTDPEAAWQIRLAQDFDLRRYTFGASVAGVENFSEMKFDAPASNLAAALKTLNGRFKGQALAGVFLFSDGNSTDDIAELPKGSVAVFPVVSDAQPEFSDIAIENVSVTQTNFEDSPVTIQARLTATGKRPEKIRVTLKEASTTDPAAETQTQTLTTNGNSDLTARFQVKPPRPGVLFYEVTALAEGAGSDAKDPAANQEATLENNHRLVAVNRDPHVARILYVGGRPNWEHKFLGRALAKDDQLQLVSLVRIARKEARFDFRGRVGESSNSLFRGFKEGADEETEDYSQPVLIRLNTKDAAELSDGFPKAKKDLYQYDAVIIDDTEAGFFTRDQLSLLDKFVSERGGGLLMLGGRDSFRHGKWDHTPVADALPIYLNKASEQLGGELHWSLTREGWLEPWTRSRDTETAEKQRLEQAPPLTVASPSSDLKPGARVLASVQDESGRSGPGLVVQPYGQGRTGALLIGDMWRWGLQEPNVEADDAGKFWRQLARWLSGDVPRRIDVGTEPSRMAGLPAMSLRIRLKDQEYQPMDGERVSVKVRQPDGTEVTLDAQPSLQGAGLYEVTHVSRQAGPYLAEVTATAPGSDPLKTQVGWTSDPVAAEFQCSEVNLKQLEGLASQTGGEVVKRSQLDKFVADLPYRNLPVMETETTPLWHRPWILLSALSLLAAEWGLRRWRGLA
ncbi:glutamine amidotransferase [Planctomicrobium piriforme]|uniref:glutamine amidotransferase n=1 Tax=Planctomicrobium piriforme TaxID=1576369 RepID=UPI000B814091|nr:glutamine amidotransferase [Planctomicrobium piriforme]